MTRRKPPIDRYPGDWSGPEADKPVERKGVYCEQGCDAFEEPRTPKEYRQAFEHWRDHGYLNGCSHGN